MSEQKWKEVALNYRDALLVCRSALSSLRFASPEVVDLHLERLEEAVKILDAAEINKLFDVADKYNKD
jgi:hypothetical protein